MLLLKMLNLISPMYFVEIFHNLAKGQACAPQACLTITHEHYTDYSDKSYQSWVQKTIMPEQ